MNERSRNILVTRSRMVSYIRRYFDERDFIEVETPMMGSIAGGATAKVRFPAVILHGVVQRSC